MPHVALYSVVTLAASLAVGRFVAPGFAQFILGMWTPAIVAILFVLIERRSFKEALGFRMGRVTDHLVALAIAFGVGAATAAIGLAAGYLRVEPSFSMTAGRAVPSLLFWMFAALGEELGWRGYMHHGLKGRPGAPLIIGLVWAAWHLPSLLQSPGWSPASLGVFLVAVLQISCVFGWLADRSGSVLVCATLHGAWDFTRIQLLFGAATGKPGMFTTAAPLLTEMEGVFGIAVVAVLIVLHRIFR